MYLEMQGHGIVDFEQKERTIDYSITGSSEKRSTQVKLFAKLVRKYANKRCEEEKIHLVFNSYWPRLELKIINICYLYTKHILIMMCYARLYKCYWEGKISGE